tara:strand:- start:256 stop:420 length:165 start_codon:yes stop_codon:yes gene_type:complete
MVMQTGEVFGWLLFFIFISVLFFAAFGGASVTEDTVEEYIQNLMQEEATNKGKR